MTNITLGTVDGPRTADAGRAQYVWVVRHGEAGRKGDGPGPDDQRPLDAAGRRQAEAIARALAARTAGRLRSSPTRRCHDTLAPLARHLGRRVDAEPGLAVGGHAGGLLAFLADTAMTGDVVCTHGEVMRPALEQLLRGGATVVGDEDALLAKGVVWHLDLDRLVLRLHGVDEPIPPVLAAAGVGRGPVGPRPASPRPASPRPAGPRPAGPAVVSPARAARAVRGSWRAR